MEISGSWPVGTSIPWDEVSNGLPDQPSDQLESDQEGAESLELQKQLLEQKEKFIHKEQQRLLREQTSACLHDLSILQHAMAALDAKCNAWHVELSSSIDTKTAGVLEALEHERSDRSDAEAHLQSAVSELKGLPGCTDELGLLHNQIREIESCFLQEAKELRAELDRGLRDTAAAHSHLHSQLCEVGGAADRHAWGPAEREALRSLDRRVGELERALAEQAAARAAPPPRARSPDGGPELRRRLEGLEANLGEQARRAGAAEALGAELQQRLGALEEAVGELTRLHEVHRRLAHAWESSEQQHHADHGELRDTFAQHADVVQDLQNALDQERASRSFHSGTLGKRLDRLEAEARGQNALVVRMTSCEADVQELRERLAKESDRLSTCEAHGAALADLQSAHADLKLQEAAVIKEQGMLIGRVDGIERILSDASRQQDEHLRALRSGQDNFMDEVHAQFDEVSEAIASEQEARVACANDVMERLNEFEHLIEDAGGKRRGDYGTPASEATTIAEASEQLAMCRGGEAPAAERVHLIERGLGKAQGRLDAMSERLERAERSLEDLAEARAREPWEAPSKAGPQGGPADALARRLDDAEAELASLAQGLAEERAALRAGLEGAAGRAAAEAAAREAQCGALAELLGREREQLGAELAELRRRAEGLEGRPPRGPEGGAAPAERRAQEAARPRDAADPRARRDAPARAAEAGGGAREPREEEPGAGAEAARPRSPARGQELPSAAVARGVAAAVVKPPVLIVEPRPLTQASVVWSGPGAASPLFPAKSPLVQQAAPKSSVQQVVPPVWRVPSLPVKTELFSQMDTNGDGVVTRAEFGQFQRRQAEAMSHQGAHMPATGPTSFVRCSSPVRSTEQVQSATQV